jgi:hypothetical protein
VGARVSRRGNALVNLTVAGVVTLVCYLMGWGGEPYHTFGSCLIGAVVGDVLFGGGK